MAVDARVEHVGSLLRPQFLRDAREACAQGVLTPAGFKAAEDRAASTAEGETHEGPSTALVLADRAVVIRRQLEQAYPVTRRTRITYSGRGYNAGYAQGQRADIGNTRLKSARALSRA